ncbi:MAG: UDP-2,3-diacylglucosamine diphosphatase LpxI [Yoonia sp.]|nr:UDP-2,3-diacylglucosamine diphosphatase LpxI [Yoonia sp.]
MLALIAGTGALPPALIAGRSDVYVCAMAGFPPAVPVNITFRIEHLGSLLAHLKGRGVKEVCFAGAVKRPVIDPAEIDAATAPLVPVIAGAIAAGDDGALRAIIGIFEAAGFVVRAAHELAPHLLPVAGVPTLRKPNAAMMAEAVLGQRVLIKLGKRDLGQACVIAQEALVAREGPEGTDAMLASVTARCGILFKGPKPDQDRRADLPVIGLQTAKAIVAAGLDGIVITAGGVMVLDIDAVTDWLDAHDKVLWVRPEANV